MQEARYLGRVEPGMDVCDVNGDKFGSIVRIYRQELATVGSGAMGSSSTAGSVGSGSSAAGMPYEEILEVKTGLFGLGKHLYIPFSAIQDVTSGCVFVNMPKDRMDEQGWDVKPDYLDELG